MAKLAFVQKNASSLRPWGLGTPESSAHRTHHGESQRSGGAPGGSGQNPSVPDPEQCGHGWSSFKVVSFGASDGVVLLSGSVPGWVRFVRRVGSPWMSIACSKGRRGEQVTEACCNAGLTPGTLSCKKEVVAST